MYVLNHVHVIETPASFLRGLFQSDAPERHGIQAALTGSSAKLALLKNTTAVDYFVQLMQFLFLQLINPPLRYGVSILEIS